VLTRRSSQGKVRAVSADTAKEFPGTARKKHRHDLGHEDHGPVLAEGTTKAIQGLLGLWIALTFASVLWLLVDASRSSTAAVVRPGATAPTQGSAEPAAGH
jgi:hypothetical protein